MSNPFDKFDVAPTASKNPFDQFDQATPAKPSGLLRKAADLPLGLVSGALGATASIADAFGADNVVARGLKGISKGADSLLSPEAKVAQMRQGEILDEAKGKGFGEQLVAGGKAFMEAPLQTTVHGVGSVAPFLATSLIPGGAAATAARVGMGLGMGAGAVKGSINEEVTAREIAAGKTPEQAAATAEAAQAYGGKNTDQIALGAGLGVVDAAMGVTPVATKMLRQALGKEVIEQGAKKAGSEAAEGMTKAGLMGAAKEMPVEFLQGGQEQVAANIAAQREGYSAGTFDGAFSQGALEALASAGPGAGFGIMDRSRGAQPVPPPAAPSAPVQPAVTDQLGQSLTGTPMSSLMAGGGLTGAANPLGSTGNLTTTGSGYPGMNTAGPDSTVDPETGAIIPAEPGIKRWVDPNQQPVAPTPLGGSLTGSSMASMMGGSDGMTGAQLVPIKPSEQMGLNPAAGPLSAAAVTAVDGTATPSMQAASQATTQQEQATQAQQQSDDNRKSSGWTMNEYPVGDEPMVASLDSKDAPLFMTQAGETFNVRDTDWNVVASGNTFEEAAGRAKVHQASGGKAVQPTTGATDGVTPAQTQQTGQEGQAESETDWSMGAKPLATPPGSGFQDSTAKRAQGLKSIRERNGLNKPVALIDEGKTDSAEQPVATGEGAGVSQQKPLTIDARKRNLATLKQRMLAGRKQPDAQATPVQAGQPQAYAGAAQVPVKKEAQPQAMRIVVRRDITGDEFEVQGGGVNGGWEKQTTFSTADAANDFLKSRGHDVGTIETLVSEWSPKLKRFSPPKRQESTTTGQAEQAQPLSDAKPIATDATPASNTAPFEHSGLKIRTSSVKVGDDIQGRWVVQSPENAEREARGERQIGGDRIVDTRDQAIQAAEQETKAYAERKAFKEQADAEEAAAKAKDEAKKEANRGKSVVERRRDAILDKPSTVGQGTKREVIETAVRNGRAIVEKMVEDTAAKKRDREAVDRVSRAGYMLGLSNENIPVVKAGLEAQARLKANKYEKPEYRMYSDGREDGPFREISKTEYDHAQAVKAKPVEAAKPAQSIGKTLDQVIADREAEIDASNARHKTVMDQLSRELGDLSSKFSTVRNKGQKRDELNERAKESRLQNEAEVRGILDKYRPVIESHPEEIARKAESRRKTQEMKAQMAAQSSPEPKAEKLPDGWKSTRNGYTGLPVYRFEQGSGQPFSVVTQTEDGYEVQVRHGDKQVSVERMPGASLDEALNSASGMLAEVSTHKDPGEKPEAVTPAVVAESLKIAAKREDVKPADMKKWLLGELDKAMLAAPDRNDYDDTVKGFSAKNAEQMWTGNGPYGKDTHTGFLNFDVPGDGKYKVRNGMRGLLEFKQNVERSKGFSNTGARTAAPERNNGVQGGSGGQMSAITNMIEEGDFEAARDYAEAVGIALADVKVPRGERKPKWDAFMKDGTLPTTDALPPKKEDSWRKQLEDAKQSGDKKALQALHDKVRVTLNGPAQAAGAEAVSMLNGIKSEIEQLAKQDAAEKPAKPINVTPQVSGNPEKFIKVAADSVRELRAMDVDRVLTETPVQFRGEVAMHIKDKRKDLAGEVDDVMADLRGGNAAPESDAYQSAYDTEVERMRELADKKGVPASGINDDLSASLASLTIGRGFNQSVDEFLSANPAQKGRRDAMVAWRNGQIDHKPGQSEWAKRREKAQPEAPKLTQSEAADLMEWVALGTKDGVTKHILGFYESKADKNANRGRMTVATVSKGDRSPDHWMVDGDDTRFGIRLAAAKKRGMEVGMAKAVSDGFVDAGEVVAKPEKKKAEAKPEDQKASTVENFGEKLPPARRAMAVKLNEDLSDDQIATLPLSKIWPNEENNAIDDVQIAAAANVMREAIPAKPRTAYKVKSWTAKVRLLRGFAGDLVSGRIGFDKFADETKKVRYLSNFMAKIKLLQNIERADWVRVGDVAEYPSAMAADNTPSPTVGVTIDGKTHWLRGSGDVLEQMSSISSLLGKEAPESRMQFEIRYEKYGEKAAFINKKGDKQHRRLMEFGSVEDARKALKDQYAELVQAWEGVKARDNITERDVRGEVNRDRTGKDHRKGKDVSVDEFSAKFGFRGGEFGSWVNQGGGSKDRQFMLNNAYDALIDLSDLIGIPPKAISLEGSLGIAFGSRGSGGAAAHFEPSNLVINLTKTRGAGSLAHEWFHALDNYFARKRGGEVPIGFGGQTGYRDNNYITHRTTPMMVRRDGRGTPITKERLDEWRKGSPSSGYLAADQWIEYPKHKAGVRAEVEQRFDDLVKSLNASPMLTRSRLLDGVKESGDGYWSRTIEIAARSFESYIQKRMLEQGYHNDFLVNVKDAVDIGKNQGRYPYLMPSEVAPVADAFDQLFQTVQTKEDEDGNVAMFSRTRPVFSRAAQGQASGVVQSIVDAITARWANAPKVVVAFDMNDPAIPERVRQEDQRQRSGGATGTPEGFYYKGTVYLMSSKLANPRDVVRVLLHESLGHFGLRGVFGKELKPLLQQIATMRKSQIEAKMKEYGLRGVSSMDRLVAAEEVLAEMAQNAPTIGFVRRAVATIKAWLRKHVPGFMGMNMSDDEIVTNFIIPARNYVVNGGPSGGPGGGVRFQRGKTTGMNDTNQQNIPGLRDVRKPKENLSEVGSAMSTSFKVLGNRDVPMDSLTGAMSASAGDADRTQKLANTLEQDGSYFERVIVDDAGNVIEGQHRVAALRLLGAKTVPAVVIQDFMRGFDSVAVGSAMRAAQPMPSDRLNNLVANLAEIYADEKGKIDEVRDYEPPRGFEKAWAAGIELLEGQQSAPDTDGAAMFSRTVGEALNAGVNNVKAFDVTGATSDQLAHYRGMGMQVLGRRQIVDLYGDMLPELKAYDGLVQKMDADKNESGADADALVSDWAKLDDRSAFGLGAAKNPGMERKLAELMHDATLAQIDPDKPIQKGDDTAQHAVLSGRFNALSPKAQDVYRTARDMYANHFKKVQEALQDRIQRSGMDETSKAKMIAKMDADLFNKLKGVYFPLARFGKYVVVSKNEAGETVSVSRAETLAEANKMRREVVKNSAPGVTVSRVYKDAEFNASRDAVGKGFVSDLMTMLQGQGVGEDVLDSVGQLYLSSLPDLSWAKHGIHRKGTPGFSQDARRAFAQNMFHGARHLAKLRYSDQLADKLMDMEERVKDQRDDEGFDQIKAQQVVDEMNARHETLMNPKTSSLSTALTSVGFVWFLGISPASAMVNLSQTALVAYPVMAAKWGFQKAGAALLSASVEVVRAGNDLSKVLKGDELAAFQKAVDDGTIDVTQAHDLAGVAQGEDERVAMAMRPVMRAASFMFHHAEKFNRQATFIAAYRLAKENGADAEKAFEQAKKATYDGHFDYSASNRPRLMQGNWQKVLFLFKQYGQNMVYTLTRQAYLSMKGMTPEQRTEARKQLGGLLAMHAMAAGALGLPLVGVLLSAASMLGGDDDEPWDAEVALKNMMADAMGPKAAEVMAHGLSRLTPWDLSGRVALNKLILPNIQEGLEGQPLWEKMVTAAAGPVAGIGGGFVKGMAEMGQGQYQRGLESMLPVALKNTVKAMRFGEEGAVDKTGVVIKDEVGAAGVIGQAMGFRPSDVALATEGKTAIYQADKALTERRSNLVRLYAMARMNDDSEGTQDALDQVRQFNDKNPNRRITMPNLMQSVRNRQRRIDDAEQGVYLPKNRRDALEAGRFALVE